MGKLYNSNRDIILLGAGGHSKVIIDTIMTYHKNYKIIGITDRVGINEKGFLGIKIIGNDEIISELYNSGLRKAFITVGSIGNYQIRLNLYKVIINIGIELVNVIHGKSIISKQFVMGTGNAILAGAIINPNVMIGDNCIINTGCIIEHDCVLGNNVHIAPGAKLSGGVIIGENTFIGIGSNIIQGIKIGRNCIIGAGSTVIRDIPSNSIAVGLPAKVIRER